MIKLVDARKERQEYLGSIAYFNEHLGKALAQIEGPKKLVKFGDNIIIYLLPYWEEGDTNEI